MPILERIPEWIDSVGVMCQLPIEDDLWPVNADFSQIQCVFRSIIKNAKETMPEGGRLNVEAKNLMPDAESLHNHGLEAGPYVDIMVHDTGKGIPDEHLGLVFDPYFSTKERGVQKGMGLGLPRHMPS